MRQEHELPKGVICERCLNIVEKGNYTTVKFFRPVMYDNTGVQKIISRINLCNDCYEEYKKITESFTNRTFVEDEDKKSYTNFK